jgi:hypothetical protein
LFVDEVRVALRPVPSLDELKEEQALRERSHLFRSSLLTEFKERCLKQTIVRTFFFIKKISTYKIGPQSFQHLPNRPIFQTFSDLEVVVVCAAPDVLGGEG